MIEVMIADDHSMVREGIKALLELDGDIRVIEEAVDGLDCLKKMEYIHPDILLLDINMPNMNGIEVLKKIRNSKMNVKILILTVHNEVEYLMKAIDIGIEGYVLKDSESSVLKKAIVDIMKGDIFIQPDLIPPLNAKKIEKNNDKDKLDKLTNRERDVLLLLAVGMYNKEIAERLNISERTVKNHVSNLFKKLGVTDRTQAAVFAIRNNLIQI